LRTRLTTVLVTLGLTLAGVASASPASADAPCTITNFSPRSVVVGLSPVTTTFKVSTTGCTPTYWNAQDSDWNFYASTYSPQDTFYPWFNSDAGPHDVVVSADNSSYAERQRTFVDGFDLLRRTTWQTGSFNASPEPVKKGAPVTVKGRLLVADWDADAYVPYAGRTVQVQFRTPNGSYATVGTAKTGKDGWVTTTVKATATGVWRLRYGGNSVAGPAYPTGDTVQVNR
jgi:hypothetical protein